ncbi:MAG: sodium:proton symporter, partial [Planctomycetota bacterium]|nr:sodium:proton symporter [Planctomycetota bacterium]
QKGIVFAAGLKLIIPFIIVVPGIIAFNLYSEDMRDEAASKTNKEALAEFESAKGSTKRVAFAFNGDFAKLYPEKAQDIIRHNSQFVIVKKVEDPYEYNRVIIDEISLINTTAPPEKQIPISKELIGYQFDSAFALLIKKLIPPGLRGFMLAAILGAVTSSLASMLNAASTIFTMDLFAQYINPNASQKVLVMVGRICVIVFVAIGCLISPLLGDPRFGGIFTYIQEFQGFISPGVLAIFVFGMLVGRAPRSCGTVGLLLSPIAYGILKLALPDLAFLDRMAITFFSILAVLGLMRIARPLPERVTLPDAGKIDLASSKVAKVFGVIIVVVTVGLYIYFR